MPDFEILLFEDNAPDVFLVQTALDSAGLRFHLEVCSDGREGLNRLRESVDGRASWPDLLLLDLNLPKYDGEKILEQLRKVENGRKIPVVVLTSSDSPKDRERAASFGIEHFFRKPMDLDEFLQLGEIVKSVLAKKPGTPQPEA